MARVSDCRASNPVDSFEKLIPGNAHQASLQRVTVNALSAAYPFAEVDISRLKDFVLNDIKRFEGVPKGEVRSLLRAAAAFGATGAVRMLLSQQPSAQALGLALFGASECGRVGNEQDEGVIDVLLKAGADVNFVGTEVFSLLF